MQNSLLWQVLSEPISELVPPAGGSEFGFHMCSEKLVGYKWNTDTFNDKSQNSFNNSLISRCIQVGVFLLYTISDVLFNPSSIHRYSTKVNTYRWLSAIRATCTTKSFSKGPWKIMTKSLLALLTKDCIQYSMTRDNGYLNNPQLWQTALSALLFLVVWANWKMYISQAYKKPVLPKIPCKTHFGELLISKFLVITTLFGLVWGFH